MAETEELDANARRHFSWANRAAARVGGLLCAGRAISAGFDFADDGDSGAGGWSEEHSRGLA
jgi:hypothetical protein